MTRPRLYVDEDAMDSALVRGLRSRGIDVLTAAEAGMIRRSDEDHLDLAADQGRALYSFNIADFHEIHTEWMAAGRSHAGIILAQQKRYSTGDQIRRVVRLMGSLTAQNVRKNGYSQPFRARSVFKTSRILRAKWRQSPFFLTFSGHGEPRGVPEPLVNRASA